MATTKIWPIKSSLTHVVKYAMNPEKTEVSNLKNVFEYAVDDDKTIFGGEEKHYYTTALNCEKYPDDPLKSMQEVLDHFNSRGENVAYHAYQSFKPGEVTPEECHAIGVELAKKLWGSHYQVVIASHLNCEHLHNHFVILSTSFRTGKKLDTGFNYWKRVLSPESDRICAEHNVSVVKNSQYAPPRNLYLAEKNGEPTPYNLMRWALEAGFALAGYDWELIRILRDQGYILDIDSDRKHPRIKSIFAKRWTRLERLGDYYMPDQYEFYYEQNAIENVPSYYAQQEKTRKQNGCYKPTDYRLPGSLEVYNGSLSTLGQIVEVFMTILGWRPEQRGKVYTPLSPEMKAEMREAEKKCEMYSRTAVILGREHLRTDEDVYFYLLKISDQMSELRREREHLYYEARKAETPEQKELVKYKLDELNAKILRLNTEKKDLNNLLERCGIMPEMIRNEMQMRREKREREYLPEPKKEVSPPKKEVEAPQRVAPRDWAERARVASQGIYFADDTPKQKKRDDDWER